jgi:Fur family ferric uptake transcriptional regulator
MTTEPGLHDIAATRLRRDGQRYTDGRRALVDVLAAAQHPLPIPEILTVSRDLAQSSVYRNLAVLERANVVSKVITNGEWACFELAEDLTGHHHHLICSDCGTVRDVHVPADVERALDDALGGLAAADGFELDSHRLDLVGRCAECRV